MGMHVMEVFQQVLQVLPRLQPLVVEMPILRHEQLSTIGKIALITRVL